MRYLVLPSSAALALVDGGAQDFSLGLSIVGMLVLCFGPQLNAFMHDGAGVTQFFLWPVTNGRILNGFQ